MANRAIVPRGRHAPPLEVRLGVQRQRLFEAAAAVFAGVGYVDASAEAIARKAGMSKATFYEHFANKEACLLELFDVAATEVLRAMGRAADEAGEEPRARTHAGISALLDMLAAYPNETQTLLVEVIGAGPRAAERRDQILAIFTETILAENAAAVRRDPSSPRFASRDDAFAVVGAVIELCSRQVRLSEPPGVRDLEPVIERVLWGTLGQSTSS